MAGEEFPNQTEFKKILKKKWTKKPPNGVFHKGWVKEWYFFRFHLKNSSSYKRKLFFYLDYAFYDKIKFYQFHNDTLKNYALSGDSFRFIQRGYSYFNFYFPFEMEENSENTIIIALKITEALIFPAFLLDQESLDKVKYSKFIFFGASYGILIAMLLYNFMFFFTVGYKENLYYSLSLAFFGLFNLSFVGLSYQFLWPDSPEFHQHSINIFLQPFLLFLVLFFWNILNPRRIWKNAKIYFRLLYGFIFLCTLGCLIFDVQTGLIISTIESMAISIIIPIILLYLSLKGDRISILCFISYSFLIFGSLSFTASLLGFFNLRLYMGEALQIGSVIEVILFSLVIAYKINLLKSENENSLKKELRATLKNFVFNKKFQTFVPFDFLKILGKEDLTKLELGDNTESEMAILFSDIRDFTSISENLSPQDNFKFINRYLNRVSPIIRQNSGFIDKFMGDGIMALFPKASDALMASFSILNELESFNKELETEDFKLVKIGIGIHFGKLMLGTIGEKGRMETTVISDAVNLASRLESLTKNYQTPIIVSQEFLDNMPKKQNKRIKVESLGEVKVKGKQKPVSIFKVENGG